MSDFKSVYKGSKSIRGWFWGRNVFVFMDGRVFEATVIVDLTVSHRCRAAGLNASSLIDMVFEHMGCR